MNEMLVSGMIGYLLGCFQTSIFVGRYFKKIDIREHGSQNAGASNTTAVLGLSYGVLTAFFDILKSVVAVLVVRLVYPGDLFLPVLAGTAAVVGHVFPIFFGFRGGKGVASLIGMALALNVWLGLLIVTTSIALAVIFDYVVVGSTTLYVLFVVMLIYGGYPAASILLAVGLLAVALIKHQSNYRRIQGKEELKLRASLTGAEKKHRI